MVDKHDLKGTHWEFGLDKVNYETETCASHTSENRNQMVRTAIRARTEPESMQLGKLLKKTSITLSMRVDPKAAQSEAAIRFVPQKMENSKSFADVRIAELRKANIDLAVGQDKTGKDWQSVLKSTMSDSEDMKFACKKAEGFEVLGEELRKSSVLLHAGRHDFRQAETPVPTSEQRREYMTKPRSPTVGFAETLGKALRTSSFDVGMDAIPRSGTGWQSSQHAIMENNLDKKFACAQGAGFQHLKAELRKTNISLGTDRTVYGSEGAKRPLKDDRGAVPAGHVCAL